METNTHLIMHNVICIISLILTLGVALFTYLNGPRKTANIALSLTMLAIAVFVISHVIGVNISDPSLSKAILMFNLSTFFIVAFNLHATLALLGKDREKRWVIIFTYALTALLAAFFLLLPDLFLLPSVPKMYFPNYYNPGALNWMRVAWMFIVIVPYMVYEIYRSYRISSSETERAQYKYFILTLIVGYPIAFLPNLLVYDIPFDPAIGMIFGAFFVIPLVYGSVRYGLFNVQIIAKQAFFYSLLIALGGGLITIFNYFTQLVIELFPAFPVWIIPLASSFLAVTIGFLVWKKLREGDILKYEFITTVTHKFRTPLTHIKWASENLYKNQLSAEEKEQVGYIQTANTKLVELTDLLVNVSRTENQLSEYRPVRSDISEIVQEAIDSANPDARAKDITLRAELESGTYAWADRSEMKFIIQTLLENAIAYSALHASVEVSVKRQEKEVICSVRDTGIGLKEEEKPLLFSKFYRGAEAQSADTEGMGIGLFISKKIIDRHNGRIWAQSEGPKKGSAFNFSLPRTE